MGGGPSPIGSPTRRGAGDGLVDPKLAGLPGQSEAAALAALTITAKEIAGLENLTRQEIGLLNEILRALKSPGRKAGQVQTLQNSGTIKVPMAVGGIPGANVIQTFFTIPLFGALDLEILEVSGLSLLLVPASPLNSVVLGSLSPYISRFDSASRFAPFLLPVFMPPEFTTFQSVNQQIAANFSSGGARFEAADIVDHDGDCTVAVNASLYNTDGATDAHVLWVANLVYKPRSPFE